MQSPTRSTLTPSFTSSWYNHSTGRCGTASTTQSGELVVCSPVGWWSNVTDRPSIPIGTRSVRCTIPLLGGADPPVLHVERDAEVLADDHPWRHDLDRATAIGQQLGDRRRVMEADLVDHHHVAEWSHLPFEDGADVGNGGRILGYPPRALWLGAGGDDDVVRSAFGDESRPHADAVLDRHAEAPALGELIADHVAELGPVRHRRREADLTAGLRALFAHRDPMSVAGGGDRGLEAGRSGTGYQHGFWEHRLAPGRRRRSGGRRGEQSFAPGEGVLDAPQPAVEPHPSDALLVARQAQADLVGCTRPRLGGELGVGDLPAHHTDEVAVSLGQRAFGLERVLEATDAHHR